MNLFLIFLLLATTGVLLIPVAIKAVFFITILLCGILAVGMVGTLFQNKGKDRND